MTSSLTVLTFPVGQLVTNCYIVIDKHSLSSIIIDPGDDGDYITDLLVRQKLKPQMIIATHGHFDHIMAVAELQLNFNTPFYINKADEFLIKNMSHSAKHFLGIEAGPIPIINGYLKDNESIKLGGKQWKIMLTAGHTPGSICLYEKEEEIAFVGDLIFAHGGIGRTDFSYSNRQKLDRSLCKLFRLPFETLIYPGHGEPFNLGDNNILKNIYKKSRLEICSI
jgi:glyoxylase-like metal-dependent hydrolase (beta-lactamase superfamily II)